MAIVQVNSVWLPNGAFRKEFVLDSAEDATSLPKCAPGSVAIVAAKDGPIYMVNASGEWGEL